MHQIDGNNKKREDLSENSLNKILQRHAEISIVFNCKFEDKDKNSIDGVRSCNTIIGVVNNTNVIDIIIIIIVVLLHIQLFSELSLKGLS